ncbi:MAG TPA: site-2 protease family protein [Vicinamibacterales bacterium]|nr:site-2 protease family protein [Vicinamibacterales bacterium]
MDPSREESLTVLPPEFVWLPRPKFKDRRWLHAALLLATVLTTTLVGASHYESFASDFGVNRTAFDFQSLFIRGLWYSGTILAILGCHELGHYFACRYYDVDASLPFFLPAPLPLTGTFGAFIRIREPIPSKRMLFDIGIAGPIAGFAVAVPALFIGLALSRVVVFPPNLDGLTLGEPLLFKLASRLIWGVTPDGYTINLHPIAFAAWFGLLATSLNLFPIGQLDGGHISYAVLGRRSSNVTLIMVAGAMALTWFSTSWAVWTVLMVGMLLAFGRHHPRTFDEEVPLDAGRKWLALFAVLMFVLCFTPAPIEPIQLIR